MNGARPEQAELSKDTDMSKTAETRSVIEGMVDGLNDHRIADIGEFFSQGLAGWEIQVAGQKKV
jgi:cytochrome c553